MSDIQLERENERLKLYIEDYRKQLIDIVDRYEEEVLKLKNEHDEQTKKLEEKIGKLERMINLQAKKREITDEEIQEIKDLRAKGLSYSKIAKETEWSKFTISRVLNGAYE